MRAKNRSLEKVICLWSSWMRTGYVLGYDGRENAHVDGNRRLVQVGHSLLLNDVGSQHIDCQDYHENESFQVEGLGRHFNYKTKRASKMEALKRKD